jgi:hypothetical protein
LSGQQSGSALEIVPVQDRHALDRFIRLPRDLQGADPFYIPHLASERRDALTPKGNPFFGHAEVALWIARRNGRDVGRISAQRDHLIADKDIGHFGMLLAIDEPAISHALLATAEDWLRTRGTTRVQGPFSLSINEETGLLVAGFDTPPMIMMPHDPPYLDAHLQGAGYAKARDLYAYISDTNASLPPSAARMVSRGLPANVTLRQMRRGQIAADIASLVEIFNDGWSGHWGFVPITQDEVAHMAKAMRPLLHEQLVWFAEVDGEPAAFGLCLPNLNEAIRDLHGSLLPFGWAKLLWRLKVSGTTTGRVPLMGMRKSYAATLLGQLLPLHVSESLRREAAAMGIRSMEMSWVLEDNKPMRHLAEAIGATAYKTYRVYEKAL